jgi:hypothetical protein
MMAAVLYGKEHLQVEPVSVPKSMMATSWFKFELR